MKNFKSFEINEEVSLEKFDALVRAGLANKAQLQRLHNILQKMHEKGDVVLSRADRMIVSNLFNKMLELITTDKSIFQKARQSVKEETEEYIGESSRETDKLPPVLILKRKSIRLFPNNVKVAIYHSDKLNRSFALPMTDLSISSVTEETAPSGVSQGGVIKTLREIIKGKAANVVEFKDGKKMKVDMYSAKAILMVYDAVDPQNKSKMDQLLNKDKHGFIKIADFALSKAKK
jgi:hypothetical protein